MGNGTGGMWAVHAALEHTMKAVSEKRSSSHSPRYWGRSWDARAWEPFIADEHRERESALKALRLYYYLRVFLGLFFGGSPFLSIITKIVLYHVFFFNLLM